MDAKRWHVTMDFNGGSPTIETEDHSEEIYGSECGLVVLASDYDALAATCIEHAKRADMAEASIRKLEATLTEAQLQRDSWKRIAESGLGITADREGEHE